MKTRADQPRPAPPAEDLPPEIVDPLFEHYYRPARSARGEARRNQILQAAIRLFREHGFHGTSMDQIGALAGVSGPALYHHFRNKQQILAAVFFSAGDEVFERIQRSAREAQDPQSRLAAIITNYVDAIAVRQDVPVIYEEARNLAPADAERSRRRRRLFQEYLAHAIGSVRPDLFPAETQQLAIAVIWMIHSLGFAEPALEGDQLREFMVNLALSTVDSAPGNLSRGSRAESGNQP